MSQIIKPTGIRELSHVVKANNGQYYFVDSNDTLDKGYETMIFECDKHGKNIDWSGVFVEHYSTYEAMKENHNYIINHLEEVLGNG